MAVLKFPSFKSGIARRSSLRPAQAQSNNAPLHRKPSSRRKPFPALLSSLRVYSAGKGSTKGRTGRLKFLTNPTKKTTQKRKIIHVATLNFGPFDDISPVFSNYNPPAQNLHATSDEGSNGDVQGNSITTFTCPTAITPNDAVVPAGPLGDTTLPSVYSRDSWVDVSRDGPGDAVLSVLTSVEIPV